MSVATLHNDDSKFLLSFTFTRKARTHLYYRISQINRCAMYLNNFQLHISRLTNDERTTWLLVHDRPSDFGVVQHNKPSVAVVVQHFHFFVQFPMNIKQRMIAFIRKGKRKSSYIFLQQIYVWHFHKRTWSIATRMDHVNGIHAVFLLVSRNPAIISTICTFIYLCIRLLEW